ncbi:hypothetical protein GE061_017744 [Apolygus lucorum]|uniref:Uncharacterized protein n=1 Tax=Apolygus lucorum TaxID=248454 RepID=A0A8S9XDY6_APOLU|nr:hypothetical protein GE061_017744 [Apolygus lucorum]
MVVRIDDPVLYVQYVHLIDDPMLYMSTSAEFSCYVTPASISLIRRQIVSVTRETSRTAYKPGSFSRQTQKTVSELAHCCN